MRRAPRILLNTPLLEIWPAGLLRARSNADARRLASALHVVRRKRDGAYVAVGDGERLEPLRPAHAREPGLAAAVQALRHAPRQRRRGIDAVATLPLTGLQARLQALRLDADTYAQASGLALVAEPAWLAFAGLDRYRRALWLQPAAARAWSHMREDALREDVLLDAISGYRSHDYQLGIFERKRARGQAVDDILQVNAAPGFSEHHSGFALDIGTRDAPPAEASFEQTDAFAWLTANAGRHGFHMSYPRDNPHGIVYEPWHWRYRSG